MLRWLTVVLVLASCGGKKLDRSEIDRIVKASDRCGTDLACTVMVQVDMEKLVSRVGDLSDEDKEYLAAAVKHVDDRVETVKATPPGHPPAHKP